jgi:uncharacterized membrane protein
MSTQLITTYGVTLIALLGIDAVWLGTVGRTLYPKWIGHLMANQVNWSAAGLFYLVYTLGVVFLVVMPNAQKSWSEVAIAGALLGLVAYATYDLTNWATLKGWAWQVVILDVAWGMALTAMVSLVSWWMLQRLT